MVGFKYSLNQPCMVPDKANYFMLKNKHHPQTIVTHCQRYKYVEQFSK